MGYGGILKSDVQAVVEGLSGPGGQTLSDLEGYLSNLENYLGGANPASPYAGDGVVDYLYLINSNMDNLNYYLNDGNNIVSYLNWVYMLMENIHSGLGCNSSSLTVAELLDGILSALQDIDGILSNLSFSGGQLLVTMT